MRITRCTGLFRRSTTSNGSTPIRSLATPRSSRWSECRSRLWTSHGAGWPLNSASCPWRSPLLALWIARRLHASAVLLNEDKRQLEQRVANRTAEIETKSRALIASERKFSDAMACAPDAMSIFAADGRIVEVNAALCDLLGYTRDELLAMDVEVSLRRTRAARSRQPAATGVWRTEDLPGRHALPAQGRTTDSGPGRHVGRPNRIRRGPLFRLAGSGRLGAAGLRGAPARRCSIRPSTAFISTISTARSSSSASPSPTCSVTIETRSNR